MGVLVDTTPLRVSRDFRRLRTGRANSIEAGAAAFAVLVPAFARHVRPDVEVAPA